MVAEIWSAKSSFGSAASAQTSGRGGRRPSKFSKNFRKIFENFSKNFQNFFGFFFSSKVSEGSARVDLLTFLSSNAAVLPAALAPLSLLSFPLFFSLLVYRSWPCLRIALRVVLSTYSSQAQDPPEARWSRACLV